MSRHPSHVPQTAFIENARTTISKKLRRWRSIHGINVIFYTYMALVCALVVFLMKPYFG